MLSPAATTLLNTRCEEQKGSEDVEEAQELNQSRARAGSRDAKGAGRDFWLGRALSFSFFWDRTGTWEMGMQRASERWESGRERLFSTERCGSAARLDVLLVRLA